MTQSQNIKEVESKLQLQISQDQRLVEVVNHNQPYHLIVLQINHDHFFNKKHS